MIGDSRNATRLLAWDALSRQLVAQGPLPCLTGADGPLVTVITTQPCVPAFISTFEQLLDGYRGDAARSEAGTHSNAEKHWEPGLWMFEAVKGHVAAKEQLGASDEEEQEQDEEWQEQQEEEAGQEKKMNLPAFRALLVVISQDMLSESPCPGGNTPAWCHLLAIAHMISSQILLVLDTDLASHPAATLLMNLLVSADKLACWKSDADATPPGLVIVEQGNSQDSGTSSINRQLAAWSRLLQDAWDPDHTDHLTPLLKRVFRLHDSIVILPAPPAPIRLDKPKVSPLITNLAFKLGAETSPRKSMCGTSPLADDPLSSQAHGGSSLGLQQSAAQHALLDDHEDDGSSYAAAMQQHLLPVICPEPVRMLDGHRLQPEHVVALIQAYLRLVQKQPGKEDSSSQPQQDEGRPARLGALSKSFKALPRKPGVKAVALGPVPSVQQVWNEMLETACAASAQVCLQEYKERMAAVQTRDPLVMVSVHQVQWTATRRQYLDSTTHMDGQAAAKALRDLRENCNQHSQLLQEKARSKVEDDRPRGPAHAAVTKDARAHRMSFAGSAVRPSSHLGRPGMPVSFDVADADGGPASSGAKLPSNLSQSSLALLPSLPTCSTDPSIDGDRASGAFNRTTSLQRRSDQDLLPEMLRGQVEQSHNLRNAKRSFAFLPYVDIPVAASGFRHSQSCDGFPTGSPPSGGTLQLPRLPSSPLAFRRQGTSSSLGGA